MEQRRSGFFYGYWVLFVCFLSQVLVYGTVSYSFSLFVKPLNADFGWSRAAIMTAPTIVAVVMGLTSPLVGRVTPRYGAKNIIALGAIIVAIGFALLSLMQSLWQFYLLYAIIAIGGSAMGVVPASLVVSNWFKKQRGLTIGILGAGLGVGGFTMPMLMGILLIPHFGWRNTYLISGLLNAAIITPLSLLMLKTKPEDMGLLPDGLSAPEVSDSLQPELKAEEPGLSSREAFRTSAFWLICIAFTAFSIGSGAAFQNQVPHLQDIGFTTALAASAMSAWGIGSAVGKLVFGWLCDLIAAKYTLVIGCAFQVVATIILMNIKPDSPVVVIWFYALLFGLGIGCWVPSLSMTVSFTFGLASYGPVFGMANLIFMAGGAIAPLVAGLIYDVTESYYWAFAGSIAITAIAIPTIILVRRPKTYKE